MENSSCISSFIPKFNKISNYVFSVPIMHLDALGSQIIYTNTQSCMTKIFYVIGRETWTCDKLLNTFFASCLEYLGYRFGILNSKYLSLISAKESHHPCFASSETSGQ